MLIQCTACGAQAKIPDSKEGAKVRCPSCSHVFVARRPGARGKAKEDPTKYFIVGGAVLVGVILLVIATSGDEPDPPPAPEVEVVTARGELIDELGWDSPAATLARAMHDAAAAQNRAKLQSELDAQRGYADWTVRQLEENAADIAEAEEYNEKLGEGVEPVEVPAALAFPAWDELDAVQRAAFATERIDEMLSEDDDNLVRQWRPLDGKVVLLEEDRAVVHLGVKRRDGDFEERTVEWRLSDHRLPGELDADWKIIGWSRYLSPAELAATRKKRHKKTVKRTLEDGSLVIEGEIRSIPYDAEVPQSERERIDALVVALMDLGSRPGPRTQAHRDLVATGKPAIAPLLTMIANTVPIDDEDEAIQLGLVHRALSEITGYVTTYKPSVALGATEERMDSGLKQWFGWFDRKYKRFDGADTLGEDPLWDDPDWQPRTERERLEFERLKRERAGG